MSRTPEGQFRDYLDKVMKGAWIMTWHEDREINPGVPDVSYVMTCGEHETGWLELKAIHYDAKKQKHKFNLEASQHSWIQAHCERVPVHLLLCLGDYLVFLVDGSHHRRLGEALTIEELKSISTATIPKSDLRVQLTLQLRQLTNRRRHV